MHGHSLVQSQGISPQASQPKGNVFEPIPTLYYLVRNNPRGVYHFLQDQNIPSGKNNTSLYNGVKNFVKHANQQEVLAFVQAIHPDKKYFDSPIGEPSNLDAKIDEWEKEKKITTDPDVRNMLDELIAKAKDLAQQGKGTVEELISEFKGAKKDSDFYKQVSIIAIVVIILLIVTRK
jgi:hypothetical protein